ncbi:MazG nucleotide pyrophosphohydrolase domain-containing protein [Streptosporangium becharense]|uniref:MazG nucleotide pyrophosphohydrolase domain-containing protein n=1 Tax=Streptosporangium becharense TaxID=1816182 RepID=UPI00161AA006|nr:MazG nucleotide pyrophosphohydrolase domain-containing protein [Streptosporangium becharense]
MVREFHERFGFPVADALTTPDETLVRLRQRLLDEEVKEVTQAVEAGDLKNLAQELADVVYVVYGTALTYGIDLDAVLAEVHRSNMTKEGSQNGKAGKGPNYEPPDLARVLGLDG